MLDVIFTLDYEIHGNGDGSPFELMVEPTDRMLRQFEAHGARLTIMADIGEILKFKEYAEHFGHDRFHYHKIADQLRAAVRRGHDVQLHIHSSYFNARYQDGHWVQNWIEYNFARLEPDRMNVMIRQGKEFLESLLIPVRPDYRCIAFRAANWSVQPSENVVRALAGNGIQIDSSVFKHGHRDGLVSFDYADAHSNLVPWRASSQDLCKHDPEGPVWEFPIYAEPRGVGAFLTPNRIYRACLGRMHRSPTLPAHAAGDDLHSDSSQSPFARAGWLGKRHAWKADFNQCSGRQLVAALERAESAHPGTKSDLPFVLIGHSKLFNRFNAWSLRPFLTFVAKHPGRFRFGTFGCYFLERKRPWAFA